MNSMAFARGIQVRPYNDRSSNARAKAFRHIATGNNVRQTSVRGENFFKDEGMSNGRSERGLLHPMMGQVATRLHRRLIRKILLFKSDNLQAILHPRNYKAERNFHFFGSALQLNRNFIHFNDKDGYMIHVVHCTANGSAILSFNRLRFCNGAFIIRRTHAIFNAFGFLFRRRVVSGIRICLFQRVRCNALRRVNKIRYRVRISIGTREF